MHDSGQKFTFCTCLTAMARQRIVDVEGNTEFPMPEKGGILAVLSVLTWHDGICHATETSGIGTGFAMTCIIEHFDYPFPLARK